MRIRLSLVLLAGVLLASGPAASGAETAGQWRQIHADGRTVHFLDTASIAAGGDVVTCRIKRLFTGEDERAYALDTLQIHCRQDQYRYTAILIYDRDDLLMHRYRLTDQYCPVPAESVVSRVRDSVCRKPPAAPAAIRDQSRVP